MEYLQVLKDLKNKIYKPIYLFTGDEPYYGDIITDYISKNVLTDSEKAFNQTVIYGKDSKVNDVADLCRRFPMMSNNQVIILKEAQDLKDFGFLLEYVANPLKSTIFVINYKYKTLKKNTKIYKAIAKNGTVLESKKLYDNEIPNWINKFVLEKNKKIDPKAAHLLAEYLGTSLSKIASELNKLLVSIEGKSDLITTNDVSENIGISKDYNVFNLNDALGNKDILMANKIVNYMGQNQKENPIQMIIPSMFSFFQKVLSYKLLKDKSQRNVFVTLGTGSNFIVNKYKMAANKYDNAKLVQIISFLREYDLKTKGVGANNISNHDLLKELTFKILH
jgi:DNA polymerase-3 subunit delta